MPNQPKDFRRLTLLTETHGAVPVSVVECRLHSGRTHQIRVHAAHQGFPLLGDLLYGGTRWPGLERQALHAWRLAFDHPLATKSKPQRLDFSASLSGDLEEVIVTGGGIVEPLQAARDGPYD
jgi:23S rRNA pseudouridine1911/1915/1917 synthase